MLLIVLALFNTGCRQNAEYPKELVLADSLCMTNPDKAIAMLNSLAPEMLLASEPVRHYFDLLTIKAKDKAFIDHTSDSLILDVLQYYNGGADPALLPEAFYYAGRVTGDLGDAPQALEYYQKALEVTRSHLNRQKDPPHISRESKLLSCIYAQMGFLFLYQYLFDSSIESFTSGYRADSLYNDSIGMVHNLRDIAQVYQQQKKFDQSLYYYERAYTDAKAIADTTLWLNVMLHRADLLCELDRADSAHTELCRYLSFSPHLTTAACTIIGRMYSLIGEKDSAAYYLRPLLTVGTPEQKDYALVWFAQQKLDQSDSKQAIEYLKEQITLQYTLAREKNTEMVAHTNSMYNYQLQVREKERIAIEKLQEENFFISVISVFIITIIMVVFLVQRSVRQKREVEIQKERLQFILRAQKSEKEEAIAKNEARIRELLQLLESTNEHNEALEEECANLRMLNSQALVHQQMVTNFQTSIINSSIYSRLTEQGKKNMSMSAEDFREAEMLITTLLPSFIERLHCIYSFKEKEWKISLLIKMGIPQHLIAPLLCMSEEGISSARRRMYKKVFNEIGTAKQWDDFINSLS